MYASKTAVVGGTPVVLTLPADVGSVRVFTTLINGGTNARVNVPIINGDVYEIIDTRLDGANFSHRNGIRTIVLLADAPATFVVFADRK